MRAGEPSTSVRRGTTKPARTKLPAPTKASSSTTTSSITIEPMPIRAPRRIVQPCRTAEWPMCASCSSSASRAGKLCSTQQSWTLEPSFMMMRPKSPRSEAPGPT